MCPKCANLFGEIGTAINYAAEKEDVDTKAAAHFGSTNVRSTSVCWARSFSSVLVFTLIPLEIVLSARMVTSPCMVTLRVSGSGILNRCACAASLLHGNDGQTIIRQDSWLVSLLTSAAWSTQSSLSVLAVYEKATKLLSPCQGTFLEAVCTFLWRRWTSLMTRLSRPRIRSSIWVAVMAVRTGWLVTWLAVVSVCEGRN